ncbi:MAG: hypothetical protein CBC35_02915 [Planctomycetes bacterium TMED75]|nr:hypothetical protein [Planctomycetaceae bacterium]OUU95132.1 MAG: hypothetical protein CBC35_02915 [Planctomycetes bacterium TMED75]
MLNKRTTYVLAGGLLLLTLGACGSTKSTSMTSYGAVRGQDVQPGQSQEVRMTREQAEAMMNSNTASLGNSSEEVPGKPDVAAQQGATPQGVGYNNIPGVVYDPALGTLHYGDGVQHHIVHHVHYDGSGGVSSSPPPTGYVQGAIEIPDNENPNSRGGGYRGNYRGGGGMNGIRTNAYNMPVQHTTSGARGNRNGGRNNGGYQANTTGTGVPGGFFVGGTGGGYGATTWGNDFGHFKPMARNGSGVTEGFTD